MKQFSLFIFICFSISISIAQIPIGSWRDHLAYSDGSKIAISPNKIYCATGKALFSLDRIQNILEKYSKVNLLSDVEISAMQYSEAMDILVIGYVNGNIDLLSNKKVENISDIKKKYLPAKKKINHILCIGKYAYLSCGFGIVKINLEKKEIAETYFIGGSGIVEVNQCTTDGTNIFAATSKGIFKASIQDENLADYSHWSIINGTSVTISAIAYFQNKLFYIVLNEISGNSQLFTIENNVQNTFSSEIVNPIGLNVSGKYLIVFSSTKANVYNNSYQVIRSISDNSLVINHADLDNENVLWLADKKKGLVRSLYVSSLENYIPDGPYVNHAFDISVNSGKCWVVGGGKNGADNNLWYFPELFSFTSNEWKSTILWDSPARDFVSVMVNPFNSNQVYAGSWGSGVFEFSNGILQNQFSESNSSLQSMIPGEAYVRISGFAFDYLGNLWVANSEVAKPLSVKISNSKWISFPLNNLVNNLRTGKILITSDNHKWIQLPGQASILIFDDNSTPDNFADDRIKKLTVLVNEDGSKIPFEPTALVQDLNGSIWMGTQKGIAVFYFPDAAFNDDDIYAERIRIRNTQNDSIIQYLLKTEAITSIAVDGANRKWIGTEKSGVFLVSEDGSKQIYQFNAENSPILSNYIISIAIDQLSGEVFFCTDQGIVSYRANSTYGTDKNNGVYTFPNPVKPDFEGDITISNLFNNSIVKITDISGNLVYQTKALGGMATWNGKNPSGERVQSGVYLVLATSENGQTKVVTKILFIH